MEVELKGQFVQVNDVTAPVAIEYLPLLQLVQDVAAVNSEYLPAPQGMQIADTVAYFPTGHTAQPISLTLA